MNYYICALVGTILGILISYTWRHKWIERRKYLLLYMFIPLPLSAIVNIFIKTPVFSYLCEIFNMNNEPAQWPIWFLTIISIIGPLCEEGIKLLPLLVIIKLFLNDRSEIYSLGILIGSGFGIGEAWYLGYCFTKDTPEYVSGFKNLLLLLLGFGGERLFAILLHSFFTGIVSFGILIKKPIRYFLLSVLSHFLINIPACLYQVYGISVSTCGILTIPIFCILLFSVFLRLKKG